MKGLGLQVGLAPCSLQPDHCRQFATRPSAGFSHARRLRRKEQVLRAAADGFARKGIHQTTMQDICEASGMSAGALYRYFRTGKQPD